MKQIIKRTVEPGCRVATNTASNHGKILSLLVAFIASNIILGSSVMFGTGSAYADTTPTSSASANASVTVTPTIRLALTGGDLVINNLTPGTSADSNIITATITSNALYGFHLSATVGSSTSTSTNTTSLVNTASSSYTFSSITSNKASLADFSDSTWGYSYSLDNGTNWISGDYGSTSTGYNGLTLDQNDSGASGITLFNSDTVTPSTDVKFKIGAKSSANQTAGTYTNTINFYAVTNPEPVPTIQGYDLATCATEAAGQNVTLQDARDGNEYTVKYINGQCWMTQNLRYLGDTGSAAGTMTIGNNNSNVSNTSITLYSLNKNDAGNFNAYSGHCDAANGYNYACVYDSGSDTTGVWYNYYAASGGTISTDNNQTAATNDICPSGWHLPSGPNTTSGTDCNKLVGNTTGGWQDPTTGLTAFGAVAGGRYGNGLLGSTGYGYWWSATAYNATDRYRLGYNSSNGRFYGDGNYYRYNGFFVRCVRSS